MSFDGDLGFSPRPTDISNITLSRELQVGSPQKAFPAIFFFFPESTRDCEVSFQSLAELLAENYHNIWARKKKGDLEAKGKHKTVPPPPPRPCASLNRGCPDPVLEVPRSSRAVFRPTRQKKTGIPVGKRRLVGLERKPGRIEDRIRTGPLSLKLSLPFRRGSPSSAGSLRHADGQREIQLQRKGPGHPQVPPHQRLRRVSVGSQASAGKAGGGGRKKPLTFGKNPVSRGEKSKELETPVIEKRFAYTFLQRIIAYVDQAHQYMTDLGKDGASCLALGAVFHRVMSVAPANRTVCF